MTGPSPIRRRSALAHLGYLAGACLIPPTVPPAQAAGAAPVATTCPQCTRPYLRLPTPDDKLAPIDLQPTGTCPYCLYGWIGAPAPLDDKERQRFLAALDALNAALDTTARAKAASEPQSMLGLWQVLLPDYSAWAIKGTGKMPTVSWNRFNSRFALDPFEKEDDAFRIENLQAAIRAALPALRSTPSLTKENSPPELRSVLIHGVAELCERGDPEAIEFAQRWALAANNALRLDQAWALDELAVAMAQVPAEKWRPVEARPASSDYGDALAYLRSQGKLTLGMRRKVAVQEIPGDALWYLACATARKDPAIRDAVAVRLGHPSAPSMAEGLGAYLRRCGTPRDLKMIESTAGRLRPEADRSALFLRKEMEECLLLIRANEKVR